LQLHSLQPSLSLLFSVLFLDESQKLKLAYCEKLKEA